LDILHAQKTQDRPEFVPVVDSHGHNRANTFLMTCQANDQEMEIEDGQIFPLNRRSIGGPGVGLHMNLGQGGRHLNAQQLVVVSKNNIQKK